MPLKENTFFNTVSFCSSSFGIEHFLQRKPLRHFQRDQLPFKAQTETSSLQNVVCYMNNATKYGFPNTASMWNGMVPFLRLFLLNSIRQEQSLNFSFSNNCIDDGIKIAICIVILICRKSFCSWLCCQGTLRCRKPSPSGHDLRIWRIFEKKNWCCQMSRTWTPWNDSIWRLQYESRSWCK